MPTIVDRDEIVRLLGEQFDMIASLCDGFEESDWARPTCLPGWSVKDNVSHIVGTESMLAGQPNPEVDIAGFEHVRNPIGQANELWVQSMRQLPGIEVLERFREVTSQRMDALRAMTQSDFDEPSWTPAGPDETYGRFMRIRHYDCFMHTLDITEALGLDNIVPPDHVSASVAEPVAGLGYIVAKKAALPKGATVSIELTGPSAATYLVDNSDRAKVVDAIDGQPTVSIRLDSVLFLRLTGGRESANPYLGVEIELGGDVELAEQLASNLTFTI